MKRIFAWLLALLMLLNAPLALAENATTLTVGTTTAMSGSFMNGMFGSNTADIDVRKLLHGHPLTKWDAAQGTYVFNEQVVIRMTAEEVDGNRRYSLFIRSGLKYSDGTPITAADYAFSILLALSPQMQGLGGSISGADHILGSESYRTGAAKSLRGVRVLDNNTLIITVDGSHVPDFYELSLLGYSPYPIHIIAPGCKVLDGEVGCSIANKQGGEPLFTTEQLMQTLLDPATGYVSHPQVVSGPYTLVRYDAAASLAEFAINPYYSGNADGAKPTIERIIYRLVTNEEAVALLQSGEIDLLHKATKAETIDAALQLVKTGDLAATGYPRTGYSFVAFACEQPTVASAAVRQAIAHCFDKAGFISGYLGDHGTLVDGYYGIGQWMYAKVQQEGGLNALKRYAYDVAAAAELLDAEGWALNADGLREKAVNGETVTLDLTILYPEGNEVGAFLAGPFAEALAQAGVKLTAEAKPFQELLQVYYRQIPREVDMIYLASNFGTVFEPSHTYDPADAYHGVDNRTALMDAELHRLAVAMRQTEPGDMAAYCEKWVAFQSRWTEVLPAIPVYSNVYYDVYTPALQGYDVTAEQTWAEAIINATLAK